MIITVDHKLSTGLSLDDGALGQYWMQAWGMGKIISLNLSPFQSHDPPQETPSEAKGDKLTWGDEDEVEWYEAYNQK